MSGQYGNPKIPLVVIVGPTAVGKSELALLVASRLNTEIVSADSAQVYRHLNIGTAKPSSAEQILIKHHLINLVDPDQPFSVADFQQAAYEVINKLWSENKLPLMVGGTGLYIRAVTGAYAFGSKGPDLRIRKRYEQEAAEGGLSLLYSKLEELDPEAAAKIHPNDQKRIIRALEVYSLEGKPISEQVSQTMIAESPYNAMLIGLNRDREELYKRIELRVDKMFKEGFIDEVRCLSEKGFGRADPGMQVLGYRQLFAFLDGLVGLEETSANIKKETRNLAKRQLTWFRRDKDIYWINMDNYASIEDIAENICKIVKDLVPLRANIIF